MLEHVQALESVGNDENLARQATDPNTPLETLLLLAGRFPAAFCQNPMLPFVLLEDPGFPFALAPADQGLLLRYAGVPTYLLQYIAANGSPILAQAARLHTNFANQVEEDWLIARRTALAQLDSEPPDSELLRDLSVLDAIPCWIAETIDIASLSSVFPPPTKSLPAEHTSPAIQSAANLNTPPETLALLADDEDAWVRAAVATNPATPPQMLVQLKEREDWGENHWAVFRQIAMNPNTPATTLVDLAAEQDWTYSYIRRVVAHNPNTPVEALELLADDIVADIRRAVIHHPNVTGAIREKITRELLDICEESTNLWERAIALSHPLTIATTLWAGAHSPEWPARLAVACNPAVSPDMLEELREDGNRLVRGAAHQAASLS